MDCENVMTVTIKRPAPAAAPPKAKSPLRYRLSSWDLKFSPYLYISPFFLLFALVGLFPWSTRFGFPCMTGTCSRARASS
ncbi:hypothetical protein GCM10017708_01850 [Arthrobacter citreus]